MNLAPHQSWNIENNTDVPEYSIHHDGDKLSGNKMKGNVTKFSTNAAQSDAHSNGRFNQEVASFIQSFVASKGDNKKLTNDFIYMMQKYYNVTVTVK